MLMLKVWILLQNGLKVHYFTMHVRVQVLKLTGPIQAH